MAVSPFRIDVPDSALEDLRSRLRATRWTDALEGEGWDYGVDLSFLKELVTYWSEEFDWRAAEAQLNQHEQALVDAGGLKVHIVRQRGVDPDAPALLLLHGWPDSFWRFHKVLPLLTDFNVIVPSLPGFGFSERPARRGFGTEFMADAMVEVMSTLGFDSFFVHGGDIGGFVAADIARRHPSAVRGLHFTDADGHIWETLTTPADASKDEQRFMQRVTEWIRKEGAYWMLQDTKPQTAAVGVNDSPAGLAAWIVEKFRAWSDCGGDVLSRFTMDELLTNLTIYWVTETIGASFRIYYEGRIIGRTERTDIPTAFGIFPGEIMGPPREFCERFYNVVRWNELPHGGHYTAFEEPELFAADLTEFIAELTSNDQAAARSKSEVASS